MLEIRDKEANNIVVKVEMLHEELQYPFGFYPEDGGDFWLSPDEAKQLYNFLGEHFGPQDLTNE